MLFRSPKVEEVGNIAIAKEEFDSDLIYLNLNPNPKYTMFITYNNITSLGS